MPKLTLLSWNLLNFGESKYRLTRGRVELIKLIAAVITKNNASIAGFTEILSNKADAIGTDLIGVLGNSWEHKASDQFLTGSGRSKRKEQYLYLWDKNRVDTYLPAGETESFKYKFFDNGNPLKFPGVPPTKGRPPWVAFFQTNPPTVKNVVVAIMHSPGPSNDPQQASLEMAKIQALKTEGDFGLAMGDFNIKKSADMNGNNTPGSIAFAGFKSDFVQYLGDRESSLGNTSWATMTIGDCYSHPYDQVFSRPKPQGAAVNPMNADMDELIFDCVGPPTTPKYLRAPLMALQQRVENQTPPNAYITVQDAFLPFRRWVSDHAPVLADINY